MKHSIVFTRSAQKEFEELPLQIKKRMVPHIEELAYGMSSQCKKMQGYSDRYRLRVGDFRIIFEVRAKEVVILVLRIGHRKDVYR